jgi:hypothetical protein
MLDEPTRRKIEGKFETGELPPKAPDNVSGGRSPGRPCCACDELIKINHFEMEALGNDQVSRFYHPECLLYAAEIRGRIQARGG